MMPKIEIYKVLVPIPCDKRSKEFYEEAKRIFFFRAKGGISLEASSQSPCGIHQVEVLYRSPLESGDPLITVEVEASEVFNDLTKFGEFLENAVA